MLSLLFFRGAAAAIIVFDVTDTQSFEKAKAWVGELQVGSAVRVKLAALRHV